MLVGCCALSCPEVCQCIHDPSIPNPQKEFSSAINSSNDVSCIRVQLTTIPSVRRSKVFRLNLSWNHLKDLDGPSLLLGFDQMTSLNLSHNLIRSITPGVFHPTPLLRTLDLSDNQLMTLDPGSFAGAHALVDLNLSGNRLSSIEGAFAALTDLSSLDLSRNLVREITEFSFRDLVGLRHLTLSSNRIARLDRGSFRSLHSLLHLVLRANDLRQVARLHLDNCDQLSFLDLSECELTEIPRGLTQSLRYVQLRRNRVTTIRRDAFEDSKDVNILVLDENEIETVDRNSFGHLHQLQQLWLNDNRLHALPHPLPASLRRLLIDSNQIDRLTNESFVNQPQLTTFSIVNNSLSLVTPDALRKLPSLTTLDLSNNRLTRLHGDMFASNGQLQTVNLNRNPLTQFDCGCFEGLTRLRSLSLAYMEAPFIHFADPYLFHSTPQLTVLDLDNSPALSRIILQTDDVFRSLDKIQVLGLLGLDMTDLRPDFPAVLRHLSALRMSSSRWHCDDRLLWLRTWLISTTIAIDRRQENRCLTPRPLYGLSIVQTPEAAFAPSTDSVITPSRGTVLRNVPPTPTAPIGPQRRCRGGPDTPETGPESRVDSKQDDLNGSVIPITVTWRSRPASRTTSVEGTRGDDNPSWMTDDGSRLVAERPSVLPPPSAALDPGAEEEDLLKDFKDRLIIATSTVLATIVIAAVIITLIVWLLKRKRRTRRKRERKEEPQEQVANRTVITYKNKDGVLFFSTAAAATGCGSYVDEDDEDDDDDELSSRTTRSIYSQMKTFAVPGVACQSPSKDTEARRVYHWEEDCL